ncbi:uncharacterized protein EI90DRAFT_3029743, partial [Cantharellus anzutake]|uniref:uncharacterized protein n=1 Tax=Cantharellus anzutake TaxID=1750568 RepID=UPI0019065279
MLNAALSAFYDAISLLLRNQLEKRSLLENLDMVLLCLDETIDDGIILETDSTPLPPESVDPGRYHRYRHQRADSSKRLSNSQRASPTTDAAIL